ncbi:hypothetical protein [Parabacteroides sp. AM08-6]|uniref:hypothetical protein n=1 Tax=Parabacteroides sp. AM08-6 TaxID=2292053 RepID=UPI000EFE68CE|nr:hypothetical protein [Parabacteroides sp. AM08-6]RHJ82576.1 hypothetical protein DW103_09540 [Parabacteroides sp. AM08-6]
MKKERKVASKETIDILINNTKNAIVDSEYLLHNIEQVKLEICNNDLSKKYLQLIFDLLSGSLSGMCEVYSNLKSMLSSSNIYVKRYHMQMVNLSQYEWCIYLGGKDQNGVLTNLIKHLNELHCNSLELENILKQVRLLGMKCDIGLRTMTAHYDEPDIMYKKLLALNDEDVYVQRIGDQLLIHGMILKYVSPVLQIIRDVLYHSGRECIYKNSFEEFNVQEVLNDKVAESFNNKGKLDITLANQIANAWDEIESQKKMLETCEKVITFLKSKQMDYNRFIETKSVVEMQLAVSFMRYDLICSMNCYLNATSNTERSICFMHVYRIETAALTHLYGYNEERRQNSIWNRIKSIPEFKSTPLSDDIEKNLKILTSHFDCIKRNLYTHYREGGKLNISDRWQCANKMNHPKELMQILQLVTLCNNIYHYLVSLLSVMDSTEKKKNDEMLEPIRKIKEIACKNNMPDIVKMSDKLLSIFSLFDVKS